MTVSIDTLLIEVLLAIGLELAHNGSEIVKSQSDSRACGLVELHELWKYVAIEAAYRARLRLTLS